MVVFERIKLGDIAEITSGGTPSSSNPTYWDEGDINWVTLSDLHDKYLYKTERKITRIGLEKSSAKILPINTIIFSSRATIGEVSIAKIETTTNQGSKNFICDEDKVCVEFLYYSLKYNTQRIEQLASGATYKEINKADLLNFKIDLPNLLIQNRIASILSTYDDLIERNEKRIKLLEEMVHLLYTEWFVKFKFPGHEKAKLVNSGTEYNKIPEGWNVLKLSEVASFVRGCSYSSEEIDDCSGDYYIVNLKSFNRGGGFRFDGTKYYSGTINENQLLNAGDIVVAVTDMTNDRAVIARPARVPEIDGKITLSADVVKINSDILPRSFMYQLLSSYRFTETTKQKANGANVLHLKPAAILEFVALIPDINSLKEFDTLCKPVIREVDKLLKQNDILTKTRDLLIPQLVTGKKELK